MDRLPDKPSELLLLALEDLQKVESDPRYVVDMGAWHSPNGKCRVCLAGAVMAGKLGVTPDQSMTPSRLPEALKLRALDFLRVGEIDLALRTLGYYARFGTHGTPASYHSNRRGFYVDMLGLVGILQAEGL